MLEVMENIFKEPAYICEMFASHTHLASAWQAITKLSIGLKYLYLLNILKFIIDKILHSELVSFY